MRVGARDLVWWSFLMSTAHGAGLMLFPVLLGLPPPATGRAGSQAPPGPWGPSAAPVAEHSHGAPVLLGGGLTAASIAQDAAAVVVHTLAMLLVMGIVAVVVFEKVGVAILRRAWVNLDALWALALAVAGVVTLFT
jgi:hypothetical protein